MVRDECLSIQWPSSKHYLRRHQSQRVGPMNRRNESCPRRDVNPGKAIIKVLVTSVSQLLHRLRHSQALPVAMAATSCKTQTQTNKTRLGLPSTSHRQATHRESVNHFMSHKESGHLSNADYQPGGSVHRMNELQTRDE